MAAEAYDNHRVLSNYVNTWLLFCFFVFFKKSQKHTVKPVCNQTTEFRLTFSRECKPHPGCDQACPLGSSRGWCHPLLFANCWLVTKSFCCVRVCVWTGCVCVAAFFFHLLTSVNIALPTRCLPQWVGPHNLGVPLWQSMGFLQCGCMGGKKDDQWLEEQTQELTVNNKQWIFYFHPLSCLLLCFLHNYIACYKLWGFTLSEKQHLEALQQFSVRNCRVHCTFKVTSWLWNFFLSFTHSHHHSLTHVTTVQLCKQATVKKKKKKVVLWDAAF